MDDYLNSLQMSICTICGDVTAMDQDEKHECWFCHNPKIKLLTQQQFCEILSKSENQILKEISKREYTIANIDNETESPIIDEYLRNIYVRNYPYTEELKQETLDYINKTADLYESLPHDKEHPWEPCEISKDTSFFCNNLCGHRKTCPYIQDYNARLAANTSKPDDDEELF